MHPNRAHRSPLIFALAVLALSLSCGSKPEPAPAIGEAYVGPFELELISKLSPEAPVVARLHHGEHVEILKRRRRFARIRTGTGVEGWTDGRLLLSASQMGMLRQLAMNAARLPSQGKATVYDSLNVHTAPNRRAPSFYRLQEGNLVEVVAQRLAPRGPYVPGDEDAGTGRLNSYDPPSPDGPRPNTDNWSLVRLSDNRAGWALTRMLIMAIPDDVAQYAEGHRITSYFSLGTVEDQGQIKHHWLWTTLSGRRKPYQFDSFRVFVWSKRRHRYETARIQRGLVGYFPVTVEPAADGEAGKSTPRFSLILRDKDGKLNRRTYAFRGYRVRLVETEPWKPPDEEERRRAVEKETETSPEPKSLLDRITSAVTGFFGEDSTR